MSSSKDNPVGKKISPDSSADGMLGIGKESIIYKGRFDYEEEKLRSTTWEILVPDFFQAYVSEDDTVVDLGAGDGHFIRNIKAKRKIAVDLSTQVDSLASEEIEVIRCDATQLASELDAKVDVVFMSNFLEHLPTKRVLFDVLEVVYEILKPGGKVMILQPNVRYVGPAYWDYVDHHIALTEQSLSEALEVVGFNIDKLVPRFLPYTAKSRVGKVAALGYSDFLVKIYLKLPILWKIFGKQTFVVASTKSQ